MLQWLEKNLDWADEDDPSDDESWTRQRRWLMQQDDRQAPERRLRKWIEQSIVFAAQDIQLVRLSISPVTS